MTQPALNDLLQVAIDAAYAAGRRTLTYFNTRVAVAIPLPNVAAATPPSSALTPSSRALRFGLSLREYMNPRE